MKIETKRLKNPTRTDGTDNVKPLEAESFEIDGEEDFEEDDE